MPTIQRIDHVAILVEDIQQGLSFWQIALGIPLDKVQDIPAEQALRLELACEEVFLHIARAEGDKTMALRIKTVEEELLVEIIYGRGLGDLAQIKMPANLLAAPESDLDNLGLALLHQVVHDFHQLPFPF